MEAKVVERPSPLTGLARAAISLGAGAFLVIREMTESGGLDGLSGSTLWIGLGLLAVATIAGISGLLTWRTTTFIADDDEFRIERRLISQTSTRIDYTKVQSVDLTQPLAARILGLAKVHIDVGGAGGQDLVYLSLARAEALRAHLIAKARSHRATAAPSAPEGAAGALPEGDLPESILSEGEVRDAAAPGGEPLSTSPPAGLDGGGISQAPEELVVAIPPRNLLLGTFFSTATLWALAGAGIVLAISFLTHTTFTKWAAIIGIVGWAWRQTGGNWGFRMTRQDGALRVRRGALSTKSQSLRPSRIQAIAIRQDILHRVTGLYQMSVTVLGYGNPIEDEDHATNAVLLPYGTWEDVLRVLDAIWPEVDLSQITPHPQPERARWLTPLTFDTHTWGIGEHVIVAQHGLLTQTRSIVPHRRMQSASISQGPLQRRLGLASIEIHTTTGPVNLEIYHLDAAIARQVLEDQVSLARAARAVAP
ncbi:MAG: PH domain-containing protein [Tessaracoccus sp.]|uniref:PH domain-containing protein n=1 Tax=Tessaracoccus sp. TaxID=1971211 RepID=UPI001EBE80AF|nr:PH domain-containing protein [Tessaracoccus sp.]MBK7822480.1 PH domain-containing protein [Tessaracoccus sp.]